VSFEKDIFISYAHIDNTPLSAGEEGWITRFHATLEALLNMRLGRQASIWRDDKKLQGNDVFSDEIMDQFPDTALLLSVLTPRYVQSDWCTRELSEFCRVAEESSALALDNKARIFKVFKAPIDSQDSLPGFIRDILGYEFFTYENQTPLELDATYGEQYGQKYNRKVAQLAADLSTLLKSMASEVSTGSSSVLQDRPDKPVVYLAECSYDRRDEREILETELRHHGYNILPDREMPRDEAEYASQVQQMLSDSAVSLHLIGETFGAVPDGPGENSIVEMQNFIAAGQSRSGSLNRIIWLPEEMRSEQDHQQSFIDALLTDASLQFGADLIRSDIETLKISVHSTLKKLEQPVEPVANAIADASFAESPENLQLYLICTDTDRKATVPLRKYCREHGIDVVLPAFEGDAAAVHESHTNTMSSCDAVMVFYGEGDEAWKRTLDFELKKLPGYRQGRPLLGNFTYLAEPATADKQDLIDMEEADLINGLNGFSVDLLADFLQSASSR